MAFFRKKCIDSVEVNEKRIVIRADLNVPMLEGRITDAERIAEASNTIKHVHARGARSIVVIGHLGNPNGLVNERLSLKIVVDDLQKNLSLPVTFVSNCIGNEVDSVYTNAPPGAIILLENLGFHLEEDGRCDEEGRKIRAEESARRIFVDTLSRLGDIYVNDDISTAHRISSSITGLSIETKVTGLNMRRELNGFCNIFDRPFTPVLAIIGCCKLADKMAILDNLIDKINDLIIVGGVVFTFLKVLFKMEIGKSVYDEEGSKLVVRICERAKANKVNITFPVDFVTGDKFDEKAIVGRAPMRDGIRGNNMGLDVGPESVKKFAPVINKAKNIIWNGLPGVYQWENFSKGTEALIHLLTIAADRGTSIVAGGDDTTAAISKFNSLNKFTLVSKGGEATMEILRGHDLHGIKCLLPA